MICVYTYSMQIIFFVHRWVSDSSPNAFWYMCIHIYHTNFFFRSRWVSDSSPWRAESLSEKEKLAADSLTNIAPYPFPHQPLRESMKLRHRGGKGGSQFTNSQPFFTFFTNSQFLKLIFTITKNMHTCISQIHKTKYILSHFHRLFKAISQFHKSFTKPFPPPR